MRNGECGVRNGTGGQKGMSLIAAIFILVILSFMGVMFVSLISTSSFTAINDMQSMQALYTAEGGLQYAGTRSFPNMFVNTATPLGAGLFTVAVPTVTAAITNAATTLNVTSTDGFDATGGSYWVLMCDTAGNAQPNITSAYSACEKLSFTGITSTSFTGGTRGADGTTAAAHAQNAVVLMYTWDTTVATALTSSVTSTATVICAGAIATAGFAGSGIIRINDTGKIEDVLYTGTTSTCFTGCVRKAFTGVGSNHTGVPAIYQSEVSVLATAAGSVGSSVRRVQGGLMPLQ